MRFDDRIATVLAQPESDAFALLVKWRQLVDLLAHNPDAPGGQRDEALAFVRNRREEIDRAAHDRVVASLPTHLPADLAAILTAQRRGAGEPAAASDVEPPATGAPPPSINPAARTAEGQIRALLGRLEAFRASRSGETPGSAREAPARSFRWETGSDGVIVWVEGAPRGALIGQAIASSGSGGQFGVDGQASGAFARRMPFRDARLSVAGSARVSGEWRISGVPFFDPQTGAFLGYRGSARRPRLDQTALPPSAQASEGLFGTDLQPDALRQLIHELRTPLNAILGFAEMIDGQFLGPAADGYRDRARAIRQQADRLLGAVDDLDTAARIATRRHSVEASEVDLPALLERLRQDYARAAEHRNAGLELTAPPRLPPAGVDPATAERMCSRLLAATIGLAGEGEQLHASLVVKRYGVRDLLCLSISRPRAVAGQTEAELLDPGYSPEGDWPQAPALGLGFALRLVRNLAEAAGGGLEIEPRRFLLQLPAAQRIEQRREGP